MARKAKDPMAGLPGGKLTLEEAQRVISAHREAEYAERRAEMQPYVGKFFRYRNNYGSGDKGWWLYAQVTEIDALGWPKGWSFQWTTMDHVEIRVRGKESIHIRSGGWQEIRAAEFWKKAAKLGLNLTAILSRRSTPKAAKLRAGDGKDS